MFQRISLSNYYFVTDLIKLNSLCLNLTLLLENIFRPIICNYLGCTTDTKRIKISVGCSKFYRIKNALSGDANGVTFFGKVGYRLKPYLIFLPSFASI